MEERRIVIYLMDTHRLVRGNVELVQEEATICVGKCCSSSFTQSGIVQLQLAASSCRLTSCCAARICAPLSSQAASDGATESNDNDEGQPRTGVEREVCPLVFVR